MRNGNIQVQSVLIIVPRIMLVICNEAPGFSEKVLVVVY